MRLVFAIPDTLPSPKLMSSFSRPIVLGGAQANKMPWTISSRPVFPW
jgi:hypothetical protein